VLLIEVDGMAAGLEDVAAEIVHICRKHNVRTVKVAASDEERALWWSSRKMAFGATGRISPDYIVQDGVIPRTKLSQVMARIQQLSEESGLRIANVFHAGDGNLHPLICYDSRVPGQTELATRVGSEILKACVDAGGSITGEHGVGVEKNEEMRYMFDDTDLAVQAAVRQVFNPADLCNAGKLIPKPARCAEVKHMQRLIEQHAEVFRDLEDQTLTLRS
jgi:glycolate oxidase